MKITVLPDEKELGRLAAKEAAGIITETIHQKGHASMILATGTSQFEVLGQLVLEKEVNWSKVSMFHLDEYVGLTRQHPAGFCNYLINRFIDKVPALSAYYLIDGTNPDPLDECRKNGEIIHRYPVDVALIGIGENGHLAFNDPPADFETEDPYILVNLDDACRNQQLGEGWFSSFEEVPGQAISMSVKQIMKSKKIICSVPGSRKADAVRNCLENEVSSQYPASILQKHQNCSLFLDRDSSSLLPQHLIDRYG